MGKGEGEGGREREKEGKTHRVRGIDLRRGSLSRLRGGRRLDYNQRFPIFILRVWLSLKRGERGKGEWEKGKVPGGHTVDQVSKSKEHHLESCFPGSPGRRYGGMEDGM